MKSELVRGSIFELSRAGGSIKSIAKALKISRNTVRKVLKGGTHEAPKIARPESLAEHEEKIRGLHALCRGNMVRVHEELESDGVCTPYTTLTDFCRRKGISCHVKTRSGQYHFGPGQEMQHDTSPHKTVLDDRAVTLQTASLVLCYSRMIFIQAYETFNRFNCKIFLTEAMKYLGGCARRCMLDNSTVIMIRGTGVNAVAAPEMEGFANHFGFEFVAHELGDKNRSGRVERPMDYIENNFYAGRTFEDLADLNRRAIEWCDRVNAKLKRHLMAKPIDLFQTERAHLIPLPVYVPDVYEIHYRIVDVEGYVSLHRNKYSTPDGFIGAKVSIMETKDMVRVMKGGRFLAVHEKVLVGVNKKRTLPEHRHPGRQAGRKLAIVSPEEDRLRKSRDIFGRFIDAARRKHRNVSTIFLRRLYTMHLDYPEKPLTVALEKAMEYGLFDLNRVERLVLSKISGEFFRDTTTDGGGDID